MREIQYNTAIKSLKDRRHRVCRMEDEIEGLEKRISMESISENEPGVSNNSKVKNKRHPKKETKSGVVLDSTFPNEVDLNHPYRQILMAIKTKPFLLITGMCGTGKSRFARVLAYQTCPKYLQEDGRAGNFQIIAVQPDWCDSSEIMGWLNLQGIFKFTPFLHFLIKAWRYVDTPFVLCLDEMNLAKVEEYFADFLSILESRQWVNNEMISDAFITATQMKFYLDRDPNLWARIGVKLDYGLQSRFLTKGITLPPNLIVIGTANMDDFGRRFSMKVIDRFSVIEMTEIDFYAGIKSDDADLKFPEVPLSNDNILGQMLNGREAYKLSPENGDLIISELQSIDKIISESPFRFGYRIRDAALIYCAYNLTLSGACNNREAVWKYLDEVLLMKILPRISGSKVSDKVTGNLLRFTKIKYPRSYQKLTMMLNKADEFYGISFWQ